MVSSSPSARSARTFTSELRVSRYCLRTSSTGARRPIDQVMSTAEPAPMTVSSTRSPMRVTICAEEAVGVSMSAKTVTKTTATA